MNCQHNRTEICIIESDSTNDMGCPLLMIEKCDQNDFGLPFIITNTIGVSLLANAHRKTTSTSDTLRYVQFATSNAFFFLYVNNIFFFSIKIEFPHNVRIQKFELKVIINNGYPFVSVEGQLIRCAIQNF